jgi:hypothetical protein
LASRTLLTSADPDGTEFTLEIVRAVEAGCEVESYLSARTAGAKHDEVICAQTMAFRLDYYAEARRHFSHSETIELANLGTLTPTFLGLIAAGAKPKQAQWVLAHTSATAYAALRLSGLSHERTVQALRRRMLRSRLVADRPGSQAHP